MLTSGQSIVEYRNGRVIPDRLTQQTHRHYLEYAERMLAVYREGIGRRRRDLHREVEAIFANEPDCPVRRIEAFCKLLDDASIFQTDPSGRAAKLRLEVFAKAARLHPLVQTPDQLFEHEETAVKAELARKLGLPWEVIEQSLYADVMAYQQLEQFVGYRDETSDPDSGPPSDDLHAGSTGVPRVGHPRHGEHAREAAAFLSRYNVAQLQACLYRAESVTVTAARDLKTIVRYAKLAKLLHEIVRVEDGSCVAGVPPARVHGDSRVAGILPACVEGVPPSHRGPEALGTAGARARDTSVYRITFTGPASVLRETRRYGVSFAKFLPALLACRGWRLEAIVRTPWKTSAKLVLSDADRFTSHLPPPEEFDSSLEESLAQKFGPSRDGWQLIREGDILHEHQKTFTPDFTFRHEDGTEVFLEIVGFWMPEYLARRRETLRRFRRHRILLAVPESSLREGAEIGDHVIVFKTAIKLPPLLAALETARAAAKGMSIE